MRRLSFAVLVAAALWLWPRPAVAQNADDARLAVIDLLGRPLRGTMIEMALERGAALRALGFDAMPMANTLLGDSELGAAAAYALLGADERRGMSMLFESIPQSGPNIQRIAFTWFLDRYDTLEPTHPDAHSAALRTLGSVRSTANAQAALYILGLTGSTLDIDLLESHAANVRIGNRGIRDASQAALLRIGSQRHLERVRSEIAQPLSSASTYQDGIALTRALQKAAFSGRAELVPVVCSHINDAPLRDVELRVDTGRSARLALNAIVDGVNLSHLSSGPRTADEWAAFCTQVFARP